MSLHQEQLERERKADAAASSESLKKHVEALEQGRIDELPRAKILLARMYREVHESIAAEQQRKVRGGPGQAIRAWLRELEPEVAAVISLRQVLAVLLTPWDRKPHTFQKIASRIGSAFEQEVLVNQARRVNAPYVDAALEKIKTQGTTAEHHIRRTMRTVVRNVLEGSLDENLSKADRMKLGKYGLNACLEAGLCEVHKVRASRGSLVFYELTEEVRDFLEVDLRDFGLVTDAATLTMLSKPVPWAHVQGGGYYSDRRQIKYPLVRTTGGTLRKEHRPAYREALAPEQMPMIYNAANYLQDTAFEVCSDLYGDVERIWRSGGGVLDIPKPEHAPRPEFPFNADFDPKKATEQELDKFKRWKIQTRVWQTAKVKNASKVRDVTTFLRVAQALKDRPVYHPVYLDFRSRLYYRGLPNPQGSDLAKAVLQFHEKKPLGRRGLFWLKVQIANALGFDKVSFDERADYVESIWGSLEGGLKSPEDCDLFREADSPFCALAATRELYRALSTGSPESYCSGLVVHMDATCSGLQHFSAMLRDQEGAQYVNLVPGTSKADIYARVAELAVEQCRVDADNPDHPRRLEALLWRDLTIDRKLAKKPVMTYVYGATLRGVVDGIREYLVEEGWEHDTATIGTMGSYLGKVLFRAIESTVPAAAQAMRWLRKVAQQYPRDKPMQWRTPAGMLINHDYRESEELRVAVRSCGVSSVVVRELTERTKSRTMQNAVSPNFVHGLDAAHLYFTAQRMQDAGLSMVTVHDSFGTHPADVDRLHRYTREAFVDLYENNEVIEQFLSDLALDTEAPERGKLDLKQVLTSPFFFC